MMKYLTAALGLLAIAAGGFGVMQMLRAGVLADENARLARNAEVMERAAEQASEARAVAKAHAKRWERRAAEYQAALDELTEGVEDAPLDPALRDRVNRILRNP